MDQTAGKQSVDQHSLETCSDITTPSKASVRCGNVTSLKDETGIIGPRDGAIYLLVCILWLIFLAAQAPAFIRGRSTTECEYNLSMSDWRLSATPYYAALYGKWNTLVGSAISPSRLRSWEGFYAPQLADTFHSELLSPSFCMEISNQDGPVAFVPHPTWSTSVSLGNFQSELLSFSSCMEMSNQNAPVPFVPAPHPACTCPACFLQVGGQLAIQAARGSYLLVSPIHSMAGCSPFKCNP